MIMPTFTSIAAMTRALWVPSRVVDGLIYRKLTETDGDVWSDLIGEDDVWYLRDPEDRAAWNPPPLYTESFDVANAARIPQIRLDSLRELIRTDGGINDDDWRPWATTLSSSTLGRVFEGSGCNPATALMHSVLLVHAYIQDEHAAPVRIGGAVY